MEYILFSLNVYILSVCPGDFILIGVPNLESLVPPVRIANKLIKALHTYCKVFMSAYVHCNITCCDSCLLCLLYFLIFIKILEVTSIMFYHQQTETVLEEAIKRLNCLNGQKISKKKYSDGFSTSRKSK